MLDQCETSIELWNRLYGERVDFTFFYAIHSKSNSSLIEDANKQFTDSSFEVIWDSLEQV